MPAPTHSATPKQMSALYRFTLLKFWEPEVPPQPTIGEATSMLGLMFDWMKVKRTDAQKQLIVAAVQRWFPGWTGDDLAVRFGKNNGNKNNGKRPSKC